MYTHISVYRRDSRGLVAAGNHKKKTNDGSHKRNVPCHDEHHKKKTNDGNHKTNVFLPRRKPLKKQRRKPVLKTPKQTRNRSIHSKMLDPPAAAESTKSPATETINKRSRFPATTETIKRKPTTETINNVSCDDGSHKKDQRRKPLNKKTLDDIDDGNHKKHPDGFRDKLSVYIYIHMYIYIYIMTCSGGECSDG